MEIISYKYSIPYLIFLGYLIILMLWEFTKIKKGLNTNDIRCLVIIGFLFFFGLRGFVGTDWVNYYSFFNNSKSTLLWEPGFTLYTYLIKSIYPNYFFWIFVSSLIDVILLNIIFRRYVKYYVLAFVVFLAFNGFIMEINLMRNMKSILLFMISIKYLQQKRILPYMLLNMAGVLFHISSIIYMPLYFVLLRNISKNLLWLIFIGGVVIFILQIEYIKPVLKFFANIIGGKIPDMVDAYFNSKLLSSYKVFSLGFIERILSFLLIMSLRKKLLQQNNSNIIFFNLFILFIFCNLYIAEANELSTRLSILFVCSYWILYPNILSVLNRNFNRQLILLSLIVFSILRTSMYNSFLFRYDNLLFGIQNYEQRKELFEKYSKNGVVIINKKNN